MIQIVKSFPKNFQHLAYYKKIDTNKTKLGPRATKCAFVGYASNSKAYKLLELESMYN